MLEPGRVFFTQYNSNRALPLHYLATWPVHYDFLPLQPHYDLQRSLNYWQVSGKGIICTVTTLVLWRTLKISLSRDLARSLKDMLSSPAKDIKLYLLTLKHGNTIMLLYMGTLSKSLNNVSSCSLVASLTTLLNTVAQAILTIDCQFLGKMLNYPH